MNTKNETLNDLKHKVCYADYMALIETFGEKQLIESLDEMVITYQRGERKYSIGSTVFLTFKHGEYYNMAGSKLAKDAAPVQGDWTILEFRNIVEEKDNHYTFDGKLYQPPAGDGIENVTLSELLNDVTGSVANGDFAIHSVKRNSDGAVWTVGKEAKTNTQEKFIIGKFAIENGVMMVYEGNKTICAHCELSHPIPVPSFSLLTFDGVNVTDERQMVYGISTADFKQYKDNANCAITDYTKHVNWFSTEEALTSWLAENTPLFSIVDLNKLELLGGQDSNEGYNLVVAKDLLRREALSRIANK